LRVKRAPIDEYMRGRPRPTPRPGGCAVVLAAPPRLKFVPRPAPLVAQRAPRLAVLRRVTDCSLAPPPPQGLPHQKTDDGKQRTETQPLRADTLPIIEAPISPFCAPGTILQRTQSF